MPLLIRVELPDIPGSLGRVATAIGEAGGDIEAIEIVAHRSDGWAVDDVLMEMAPGVMPDSVVSACNALDGVEVLWVSRYAAGGNLFLDLEVVEELTTHGASALDHLVGMLPVTFRVDWAARLRRTPAGAEIVQATEAAPARIDWADLTQARTLPGVDDVTLYCGAPLTEDEIVVMGRDGGPEFLDSELARIGHLLGLAVSISRS
ncbi:MAG TPA: amino acid-binding protein [Nocardioides sp.]|uniref:ACT domain-containing protein n=1 Tax=Nocardioides sp. TaxID=35761 RepID=UPI002CADA135|nr:ACT domain-containing protein [Nocardioides sp.]HQR28352.1 amino acid-binding protein [Nocardioides sp.]